MWAHVAQRLGKHPAVAGYDLLNEPTPGSAAPEIFANLIGAFAAATGQDPQALAADFSDPQAKFSQLDHLNDEDVHRQIGDSLHPLVAAFETELVAPLMARVVSAVRQVDPHTLICESTTILPTWASRRVSHHLRTATGRTPPLPC